jgi:S-disulfanyl-L-cysteine oxidoreductase SoxD
MYDMRINAAMFVVSTLYFASAAVHAEHAAQEPASRTVWNGVYSEAQSKRGETAYSQYCAKCHGPDLSGADVAPPLTGVEFNSAWNDLAVGELFERLRVTMPADKPGSVSAQDNADIVAFLLSKNGFPAGEAELPPQLEILKTIKILTQKPQGR